VPWPGWCTECFVDRDLAVPVHRWQHLHRCRQYSEPGIFTRLGRINASQIPKRGSHSLCRIWSQQHAVVQNSRERSTSFRSLLECNGHNSRFYEPCLQRRPNDTCTNITNDLNVTIGLDCTRTVVCVNTSELFRTVCSPRFFNI